MRIATDRMFNMKKLRLSTQIATSLLVVAVLVGIAIGEIERRYETKRLNADLEERAGLTVSLIGGLLLEAILVRDIPLIDTAIHQAIELSPDLLAITVFNANGEKISYFSEITESVPPDTRTYIKDIVYEGDTFGSMEVIWSTAKGRQMIAQSVNLARINTFATLALISALFLALVAKLAMRPLQIVHDRMTRTMERKTVENHRLPKFAAVEFHALNKSVSTLETALSERDQREHELRIASQQATKASKTKSEFLANMSHEIRTPMNGIIGMAELILETDLDRDQKVYAETISKSGSALLTIINDILDFSKIEAGKLELDPMPFDLNKALEDITTLVAAKASQKDVEVTLRFDPKLPHGYLGDAGRIRQIMTNIIGNAAKFTLQGYVLINVTGTQRDNIVQLQFDIEDTGIGVPKEKLNNIFNEFEQVEGTASRNFEGTGLGLAISTRLVKMMGGEISVTSKVGKGSVFTVRVDLPISKDIPNEDLNLEIDLTGKTALIVDDLTVNLNILSERLRSWGIQCQTASSGEAALQHLNEMHGTGEMFDFTILDFQMPGMHGGMLAERIRENKIFDSLPIIMLSSVDQGIDLATRKRLRIDETLLKPARAHILRKAVVSALKLNTLPQKPSYTPNSAIESSMPRLALNILIAEDNKTNQLVLKTMLKAIKPQLGVAENGLEAVKQFSEQKPDLILMDMSMPEMDGLEATRRIRMLETKENWPRTPIIALTANAMKGDRELCLEAGMDDYLSKPIRKEKLLETIAHWRETDARTGRIQAVARVS